jgi:deoxyribonuclease-4
MAGMLPDGRRLGAHLPLGNGMVKAAERAHAIGASALQVFADNPTGWRRRASPPRELVDFRSRLDKYDIAPLATHAAYLINLAGPDKDFFERSVSVLAAELDAAQAYGARFVNVHAGSHRGSGVEAGARRIAEAIDRALAESQGGPDCPRVVLENSAGGGFGIGTTAEELATILDAIGARDVDTDRMAFCFDTAHLWGAGYDLRRAEVVDELLAKFDRLIGLDRLVMIHLNDTKSELGSRSDRHEHIGAGQIGPDGLGVLLCHPRLAHAAYFLETPGMEAGYDAINIQRVLDIAAGRPLPELPPEAFLLRRERAQLAPSASDRSPGRRSTRRTARPNRKPAAAGRQKSKASPSRRV